MSMNVPATCLSVWITVYSFTFLAFSLTLNMFSSLSLSNIKLYLFFTFTKHKSSAFRAYFLLGVFKIIITRAIDATLKHEFFNLSSFALYEIFKYICLRKNRKTKLKFIWYLYLYFIPH